MLKLRLAAALEVLHRTICRETCWVPKTHRCLHTELVLKGSQRGCGVVGPVTPGASGQAVLTKVSSTATNLTADVLRRCMPEHHPCEASQAEHNSSVGALCHTSPKVIHLFYTFEDHLRGQLNTWEIRKVGDRPIDNTTWESPEDFCESQYFWPLNHGNWPGFSSQQVLL